MTIKLYLNLKIKYRHKNKKLAHGIYNNVELYLYSCQDLILKGNSFSNVKAGDFYCLKECNETFTIYPQNSAGIMLVNIDILHSKIHNQIIFHQLNDNAMLCEIKPFVLNENVKQYVVKDGSLKIIQNLNEIYIYFNGNYYGCIKQKSTNIQFEKHEVQDKEYGIVYLLGEKKNIIVFDNQQVVFCGQYVDKEVLKNNIKIYTHNPNIFNVGQLINYNFEKGEFDNKCVCDRVSEYKQVNNGFDIIYFLEAIKCGRYKYAYNKLSYELKLEINIDVLYKYFKPFDKYFYMHEQDVYITLKNNKVVGIYHFTINNNMIDNIY